MSSPWSQPDDNPNAGPTPAAGQQPGSYPPGSYPPGAYPPPPGAYRQPGNPFAAPNPYSPPNEIRNGKLDGVSVAAFITACMGFICVPAPVSVGLAIAGLVRTRKIKPLPSPTFAPAMPGGQMSSAYDPLAQRPNAWGEVPNPVGTPAEPIRRRGRGFAIWGLSIGLVALLLQIGLLVSIIASPASTNGSATSRTSQRPTPSGQPVAVASLIAGDCFKEPAHSTDTLTQPVTLVVCDNPHTGQVFAVAKLVKAASYPGRDAVDQAAQDLCQPLFDKAVISERGILDISWYFPTQRRYEAGDTRVTCFVVDATGIDLTTSVITASATVKPEISG